MAYITSAARPTLTNLISTRITFSRYLLLVSIACLFGCTAQNAVVPTTPQAGGAPLTPEKLVFSSASRFYCENLRWPNSWQELVAFERNDESSSEVLATFNEPTLASPRAILLTMSYKKEDGEVRSATFIAPPYCREASSDPRIVAIAGEGVLFRLPKGVTLMKGAEVKERWKAPPYPDAAWQGESGLLIAIRFGDVRLSAQETPQFLHDLSEAYEASVPSLVWRAREVRVLDDATVLRHAFENDSSKGRLANVVLSGSFDGFLFAITVVGSIDQVATVTETADEIESSLKVRSVQSDS
jgi:hypothetical protein